MKKFERDQEDFSRLNLEEINRELDVNSNPKFDLISLQDFSKLILWMHAIEK